MFTYYFLIPLFVIGNIGNSLIIAYFVRSQKHGIRKMSGYHFLIIQLAIADLVISFFVPVFSFADEKQIFGDSVASVFVCKAYPFYAMGFPNVSCWLLVLLSYERFRTILYPFKVKLTKMKLQVICTLIWIFFTLVSIARSLKNQVHSGDCSAPMDIELLAHLTFTVTMDTFIPVTLMTIFYRRMSKKLKFEEDPLREVNVRDNANQRRKKQALKTILYLTIIYVCFVVPGRMLAMFLSFTYAFNPSLIVGPSTPKFIKHVWNTFLIFWVYVNNFANIFIYAALIKGFRSFVMTLCCPCRTKQIKETE